MLLCMLYSFFFFKQKTAYEMRISDWSSDVCSSDLTGGHIFPGIAVAMALHALGVPVLWLGSDGGMETRMVPAAGIAIETISVRGVRGKGPLRLLLAPFAIARAVVPAIGVLRKHRPRAEVGRASGWGRVCQSGLCTVGAGT